MFQNNTYVVAERSAHTLVSGKFLRIVRDVANLFHPSLLWNTPFGVSLVEFFKVGMFPRYLGRVQTLKNSAPVRSDMTAYTGVT
jgi:hypothetical protein